MQNQEDIMILSHKNKSPKISKTVFIADSADIIGDVEVADFSSIWFNATIRGDQNKIIIGNRTSIQDNMVIHADIVNGVKIGDNVSVGHGDVLHGCKIENNVIIRMNSTVLNGVDIGKNSIIDANSLIPEGKNFPEKSLIIGVPGKTKREIDEAEIKSIAKNAEKYVELTKEYKKNKEDSKDIRRDIPLQK